MSRISLSLPDHVQQLFSLFERQGFQLYIVGGIVRDILLDRGRSDWDFATDATPEEMLKFLPDSFYDNSFGTVGVKTAEKPYEVTTFRTEQGYSDGRHPDRVIWGKTLEEDLGRRDFTINAMALKQIQYDQFELIDLFGGQQDLKHRLIRTVRNADERFGEDALRMLRAVRFASQLQFAIEEETFMAIVRNAEHISAIAWERIHDELFKIFSSPWPADGYMLLRNTALGRYILPEMEQTFGVEQKSPGRHHIYDVGTHSVESLRHCTSADPVTRFATLIHDVGKVRTQRMYPDGRITFYNHEMESAKIAERIADRLRFSKADKEKFVRLVRWHQFTVDERQTDNAIRRFIRNVGLEYVPDMLALRTGDRLGGGAQETSWRLEEFKKRLLDVQKQPFQIRDLRINGFDVMKEKNISGGVLVGKYLQLLFDEIVEQKLINEREQLLGRLQQLSL